MPAPTFEQELLVARMRAQWAGDMIRIQPTMATVLRSGGTGLVFVRPDGARSDAEQLIPFVAGQRFQAGQRVLTVPIQGGSPIAIGILPTSTSQYAVVGTEHIIPGSITAALLANGAISFSSLDVDTQGRIANASSAASTAQSAALSAQSTAQGAATTAGFAQTTANNANTAAATAQSTANTALTKANSALSQIADLPTSTSIPNGAVTTAKLADAAVTQQKLGEGAVFLRHLDFDTVRQPINQISKLSSRVNKLCNETFGSGNCGIS